MLVRQLREELLVARLAAAEDGAAELVLGAAGRGSASISRSKPFCEARRLTMPSSGRRLRACVARPDALQEILLQLLLRAELAGVEVLRQVAVVARIPFLVVDAIEDAGERPGAARSRSPSRP